MAEALGEVATGTFEPLPQWQTEDLTEGPVTSTWTEEVSL